MNASASPDQDNAAVSMAGDGRFVVTWDSKGQDNGGSGGSQGIFRQEYTASGAVDGGELVVNTAQNNDQTLSAVAMDDAGNFVVSWSGEGAVARSRTDCRSRDTAEPLSRPTDSKRRSRAG